MRIMQIVSGWSVSGAAGHCLLLTRQLVRRGNDVTLVCRPDTWIAQQAASDPVEVVPSDLHRWPTGELRRVAAIARRNGIEVVHTHMSRAHSFGVLLRWMSGIPCVATAHSQHVQLHWMFNDRVIAVSEASRRYHESYNLVRSDRIVTIHNFVDYQRIAGVAGQLRSTLRASFGVEDSCPLIGVVGRAVPRKGLLYLVQAMPLILQAQPHARVLAVGEEGPPEYMAKVRSTAAALGVADKIIYTGHRDDVYEIMAALDLSVLPSLAESFPLTVLESMAAGLPVVATEVGGVPESIQPDRTGVLVRPRDSRALARAITALLGDPARRRRLGEAARRHVEEHFSAESQTSRIEAIFAGLVRRARAA